MNKNQRQEQIASGTISGRKISNFFTCTVKEVRTLSPQVYEQINRQQTFQTDSFKQILTRRSGGPTNKENVSVNNKILKKIKQEQPSSKNNNQPKKKSKSNQKRPEKKSSTISLTKIFRRDKSIGELRKKQAKSASPSRDLKDYRSGPVEKRNYLSNNASSKTSRQVMQSKSQKNLIDKNRNPMKSLINFPKDKKQDKKMLKTLKKDSNKTKKMKKSESKVYINGKKQTGNISKTQGLAKEFDSMMKDGKKLKKQKKVKQKQKSLKKKSKQKKIVVSHNNSKNFVSKQKLNSYFSDESGESPQKGILSTGYDGKKSTKRQRLSFEPSRKKGKSKQKAKTEVLSPEKSLGNKNEAATIIQKIFRGYLTRKYIKQFKTILKAVITIQRMWRGYKCRKDIKAMKNRNNKNKKKQIRIQNLSKVHEQFRDSIQNRQDQLANLLEQILNEQSINQSIRNRISDYLKKEGKSSERSSVQSHMQQEMRSEKKYFQQYEKKKYKFGSPLLKYSPKLQKSQLHKSPQIVIENLLTIKEFQRQKLINHAKMQLEGVQNLSLKKIFSPRTRDVKKQQIHKKLQQDLTKFDESMTQVIKTCKVSQQIIGPIRPFDGSTTPQRSPAEPKVLFDPSPKLSEQKSEVQKLNNSSERKLQDLSMQLLQYYEQKTQLKPEKEYEKLDSTYQFIQQYLLSLFQNLRQLGHGYRQKFIQTMRSHRNLNAGSILKNLNVLTEESDDEDMSFKLPMYKYLQQEQTEVLSPDVAQEFNKNYAKLQRHQLGLRSNIQDIYLKMIVDAVNQALNLERPIAYIFTQASLIGRSSTQRLKQLQAFDGLDGEDNQPQFSFYFANSMNHIYKWAHFHCGKSVGEDDDQTTIAYVNQTNLKQYLQIEASKSENYYDQLLQVIAALSNTIFDQIILEEGIGLYM